MRAKFVVGGTSLLVCGAAWGVMVLSADEPLQQPEWRRLIVSRDGRDTARAAQTLLDEQRATVSSLLQVLELPVEQGEPFFEDGTPRNTAIKLLGNLRDPEAVPALAKWLMPRPGQEVGSVMRETFLPPAGTAIVKIGMPAVPAVLDILASVGVTSELKGTYVQEGPGVTRYVGPPPEHRSPLGDFCLRILVDIKGLDETEACLRRYIAAEEGVTRKKNLEGALAFLRRPGRDNSEKIQAQKEARDRSDWAGWWKKQEEQAKENAAQPQPEAQPAAPAH